jgi:hypothetical protein
VITQIFEALKEPFTAIGIWLNPQRKELIRLRRAIEAAKELVKVLRKQNPYAKYTDAQRAKWEVHFEKQFERWGRG